MKSLISTIGQAPSELSEAEFYSRLTLEHIRVAEGLAHFKLQKSKPTKSKTKKKKTSRSVAAKKIAADQAQLFALLAELGTTPAELHEENLKRKEENK